MVMSSWCLRDLPESGHITSLAISGMMMIGVSVAFCVGDLIVDPAGSEKTWFACCIVSANMSYVNFCWWALRLILACGVLGVTALADVVLNLRCEFGVVLVITVGWIALAGVVPCTTLRGETDICTLGGAPMSLISKRGDVVSFLRVGSAPSKIAANRWRATMCSSPTWQNGSAGCGLSKACVHFLAAWVANSLHDGNGNGTCVGGNQLFLPPFHFLCK
jgi:hypothetical protein